MKIFTVDFEPMWPVPSGLIIAAKNKEEAFKIAQETIKHTKISLEDVAEVNIKKPCVIFYESGDH